MCLPEDMKILRKYDPIIIQHKIPLSIESRPFKQKLSPFNPIIQPKIEKEIKKSVDAKIIVPLRY